MDPPHIETVDLESDPFLLTSGLYENLRFATADDIDDAAVISSYSIHGTQLQRYASTEDNLRLCDDQPSDFNAPSHYVEMVKRNLLAPTRVVVVYEDTEGSEGSDTPQVMGLVVIQFPVDSIEFTNHFCVETMKKLAPGPGLFQGFDMRRLQIIDKATKLGCEQ